jgi:hypothetical protein
VCTRDETRLVSYVAEHSSQVELMLSGTSDTDRAMAALRWAAAGISAIAHPDEPDCPLPNWCEACLEDGVPVLHLDMKNVSRGAAQVVGVILHELDKVGIDGALAPRARPDAVPAAVPEVRPQVDPDPDSAGIFGAARPLAGLSPDGIPPAFPDGCPAPRDATLVLAERAVDGTWEHVAWRRIGRPFTDYLDQLREFGCEFGSVPPEGHAWYVQERGMARYALRRDGHRGSVSLYHGPWEPGRRPRAWYVSVTWRDAGGDAVLPAFTPLAAIPVGPMAADVWDDLEPAAIREFGQQVGGPAAVLRCEALLAVGEAAERLAAILDAQPDDRSPARIHRLAAPVLAGPERSRLVMLRHLCLTMAIGPAGVQPHGGRSLPLRDDDDGLRYSPLLREAASELPAAELVEFEAVTALLAAARRLDQVIHPLRSWVFAHQRGERLAAPRRGPLAEGLTAALAGIPPEQVTEVRDVCRLLSGECHRRPERRAPSDMPPSAAGRTAERAVRRPPGRGRR